MPNWNHSPTNSLGRKRSRYKFDALRDEADVFSEVVEGVRANTYTCDFFTYLLWHHNKCVGINDKAYNAISKLDSDRGIECLSFL